MVSPVLDILTMRNAESPSPAQSIFNNHHIELLVIIFLEFLELDSFHLRVIYLGVEDLQAWEMHYWLQLLDGYFPR
jgi:hypothetical protein